MKHSYQFDCACNRCGKEHERRTRQRVLGHLSPASWRKPRQKRGKGSRSPIVGSAEWAETHGDDLGYSGDY